MGTETQGVCCTGKGKKWSAIWKQRSREGTGVKKCPLCKEEEKAVHTHLKCSEIQKWGVYG